MADRWEYLEVGIRRLGGGADGGPARYAWCDSTGRGALCDADLTFDVSGREPTGRPMMARVALTGLGDALSYLGEEGWEVVAALDTDGSTQSLLLKRRRP